MSENSTNKNIITIDAVKLIDDMFHRRIEYEGLDPSDKYCEDRLPAIEINLDNPKSCPYVSGLDQVSNCPIFDQIGGKTIMDKLMYLDFGTAFNSIPKSTFENSREGAKKASVIDKERVDNAELMAQLENEMATVTYEPVHDLDGNIISYVSYKPYYYLDDFYDQTYSRRSVLEEELFDKGIIIRMIRESDNKKDSQKRKCFVAFDKSASMGRRNTISFIDAELLENLNKRLLLDMDLSGVELNLAKFYAYKGLYFTSSKRITSRDMILNSETVIVIDDIGYIPENKKETIDTITAIPPEEGKESSNQSYIICNKKLLKSEALKNLYDGEGFICPEYSAIINKKLGLSESTASYQIRLPFTKGMLHRVDFKGFIEEYGHPSKEDYEITDVFGRKRNLMKAKIILTKSMFKCFDWYSQLFDADPYIKLEGSEAESHTNSEGNGAASHTKSEENGANILIDPVTYYFEKCKKYHHALYIANTDDYYQGKNLVQLNYQFLNTLCFTEGEYDSLLDIHRNHIADPVHYLLNHAEIRYDDSDAAASEQWKNILLRYAADDGAYKSLYREPVIKNELQKVSESIRNKLAFGKYLVDGEIRFLSRDLLFLLYHLLNEKDRNSKKGKLIADEFLSESEFDMPGDNCGLKAGCHYAIFRSPHLSRNEQCALRFAKSHNDSIRFKYLSQLKGIIMLSHLSVDPMTLGGADFDGDLVKVINNDLVRDSVLKNRYNLQGNYVPEKDYFRSLALPVIDIHAYKVELKDTYKAKLDFDIIANTFSNSIGKLSNLSAKYGKLAYSSDAFEYYKTNESDILNRALKALTISMDRNLMSLKLNNHDKKIVTFGSSNYKLSDLKKMRKSRKKVVNYEDLPEEYTAVLEKICLENLCPSLTIYTGMDIDAPKNNIRPNIDDIFEALTPLRVTYNYFDNFKNKLDKCFTSLDHMPKFKLNEGYFQLGRDSYHIHYPVSPAGRYFSIDLIPYFFFKECQNKTRRKRTTGLKKQEKLFTNGNMEKDSDTAAAIEAYVDSRKNCFDKIRYLNYVLEAKRLEKIRIICQAQYNNTYKYEEFLKLYEEFLKFDFDYHTLKDMHNRLTLSDWQFLPEEARAVELEKLLKQDIERNQYDMLDNFMKNDHIKMLYNFHNKGYFLLYLLIGQALNTILLTQPHFVFDSIKSEYVEGTDNAQKDDIYISVYNRLTQTVCSAISTLLREDKISFSKHIEPVLKTQWMSIVKEHNFSPDIIRAITDEKNTKVYNQVFWDSVSTEEMEAILTAKKGH